MSQDLNEATRVMPAAGAPPEDRTMVAGMAPPSNPNLGAGATQMGATVVCAVCHTNNSALETYCQECGFLLASTPGANAAEPEEAGALPELIENKSQRRFRLKPGVNTVGRENCDILLMDGTVSRRHAQITLENGTVTVTDLGSTNGTQVDNNRLEPNQPTIAAPGAALRFGSAALTLTGSGAPAEVTIVAGSAEATIVGGAAMEATLVAGSGLEGIDPTAALPLTAAAEMPQVSVAAQMASAEVVDPETTTETPLEAPIARLKSEANTTPEIPIRSGTTSLGRRVGNTIVLSGDPFVSGHHADVVRDNSGCYLIDVGSTNGTVVNGQRLEVNQRQLLLDGDQVQIGNATYLFETLEMPEEDTSPLQQEQASEENPGSPGSLEG